MPSPFPAMDPYLEKHWRDVHQRLVIYAADALQPQLPRDLRARVEERVFIDLPEGGSRSVYPDIRVIERAGVVDQSSQESASTATAGPLIVHLEDEPASEGYIQIIDVGSGNRVVTMIEFLSASNKRPGEGQDLYVKKQRDCKRAKVNLVEIDLLRSGDRVLSISEGHVRPSHRTPYRVCVRRGRDWSDAEIYALPLREKLPLIRVPLREEDPDVSLDLQELIQRCYLNGGYDDLDYGVDPDPPLEAHDAAWAEALLRQKGLR